MTSVKESSAGGVPSGLEIVGAWPATAETTVIATSERAKMAARILRVRLLIF
jgi:hypothetical protein